VIRAFCTTRSAILSSIFSVLKPGVSFGTTKPLTCLSATSRAQMIVRSLKVALPIQAFCPSSTQVSPSRRAEVASPPDAPEPTSGSVRPNAPMSCIVAIWGSQRCFCSSDPHRWIEPMASPPCTPLKVANEGSTRASSIDTMPSRSGLRRGNRCQSREAQRCRAPRTPG
jgi:hypothetical protein